MHLLTRVCLLAVGVGVAACTGEVSGRATQDGATLDGGVSADAALTPCFQVSRLPASETAAFLEMNEVQQQEYSATWVVEPAATCISVVGSSSRGDQSNEVVMAAQLSHLARVPVHLEGDIEVSRTVVLQSGSQLTGVGEGGARLVVVRRVVGALLRVAAGASDVSLTDVTLDEGTGVSTGLVVLEGMNTNVRVERIRFEGSHSVASRTAGAVFAVRDWLDDILISRCTVRGLGYGFNLAANARRVLVTRNHVSSWQYYAVRIVPGTLRSGPDSTEITVSNNTFEDPEVGPAGQAVVLVSRGQHRAFTTDVTVSGNTVLGPGVPYVAATADSTNALGDTIVLHGIDGFLVYGNEVSGGGENGITVSRLSRNGAVRRNTLFNNDAFGLDIGSGYYEVTLDSTAGFAVGDAVHGAMSGASARVEGIFGNELALNPVWGGAVFRSEPLDNVTAGTAAVGTIVGVSRTRAILVEENDIYSNGVNRARELPKVWEVIVLNADAIRFRDNTIHTALYADPALHNPIHLSNSRNIGVSDSNVFQHGTQSVDDAVTLTRSSWLASE